MCGLPVFVIYDPFQGAGAGEVRMEVFSDQRVCSWVDSFVILNDGAFHINVKTYLVTNVQFDFWQIRENIV